jgi:hypothetical protein
VIDSDRCRRDRRRRGRQHGETEGVANVLGAVEQTRRKACPMRRTRQGDGRKGNVCGGCPEPDAECPLAFAFVGEGGADQREDGRRGQGGSRALQAAPGDQNGRGWRQPADERRKPEHREAAQEDATPARDVGNSSAQQEKTAQRDGVGVHHPLQIRLRKAHVAVDARERDTYHEPVHHDDEVHRAQRRHGQQPALPCARPGPSKHPLNRKTVLRSCQPPTT